MAPIFTVKNYSDHGNYSDNVTDDDNDEISSQTWLIVYNVAAVLGLVGILGNIVSLVIWTRPSMESSSSVYLVGIASGDLVIDSSYIFFAFLMTWHYCSPNTYSRHLIFQAHLAWGDSVISVAQNASTYLTLAISFERYVAVCRPFEFRFICTHSRARKYTLAIIIVAILYNLPSFLKMKVVEGKDDNGETYYDAVPTDLNESPLLKTIYKLQDAWLHLFLIDLLPLLCISVLNVLIYLEMKKSEKLKMTLSTSQREENTMTRMVVYVVLEFLVCSWFGTFYAISVILDIPEEQIGVDWGAILMLKDFTLLLNSSSNIFMYAVFGSSFRKTLLTTFSCWLRYCLLKLPTTTADQELGLRIPSALTSASDV